MKKMLVILLMLLMQIDLILGQSCNVANSYQIQTHYARDCKELFDQGYRTSGVYFVKPRECGKPIQVFCELAYDGWTIIMRRFDGSVDFDRDWNSYKNGFGSAFAEHWLGNDNIYHLTRQKHYKLRVDFTWWSNGVSDMAEYASFRIDSEAMKYKLHISGFSGSTSHDGLTAHNGIPFSTKDRDNDVHSTHCSQVYHSAFWHTTCHSYSIPTGDFSPCTNHRCMEWGKGKAAKAMILKIIPV